MSHQTLVREFHTKFSIPVRNKPGVPSDERVRLRLRLIAEEFCELLRACTDTYAEREIGEIEDDLECLFQSTGLLVDLPAAIDALADLEYVIHGSSLELGVDIGPVMAEVHAANMRKEGGGERSDGKIQKPPGWVGPDIEGVLKAQGWET